MVVFHNTSSMSSGTLTTYNWSFGDGTTSSFESPTHSYSSQGTYTVTLIVGSQRGCYDTLIKTITFNPQPMANFSVTNGCQFAPVVFTDNSVIQQGVINQWDWNFGDGSANQTSQNPIPLIDDTLLNNAVISKCDRSKLATIGKREISHRLWI